MIQNYFVFTDDGFILISGFTKNLCSRGNPLLKVNEVTTEHQKLPNISKNWLKKFFFAQRANKASAKGQSPP